MTSNPGTPARGLPRPLLWALLVVALAANALTSVSSLPAVVGVVFGVVALGLGALLVRDHLRRRASNRRSPDRL
jgi:Flp pilus assembly protein TadB